MTRRRSVILKLKGASRQFEQAGDTVKALAKTNFSIKAGEFAAIIGPSGSGKSTFLTIAGGLREPSNGSVEINGHNTATLSKKELTKVRLSEVGFILQDSNLVPYLTIEKQLRLIDKLVDRKTDESRIQEIFSALDIAKLGKKYPSDLSGGERQRAAIAKVLYSDTGLILADEPTASLDTKRAFEVIELLAKQTHEHKKATVMVTHDERLLDYCDTVYEMRDGKLTKRK